MITSPHSLAYAISAALLFLGGCNTTPSDGSNPDAGASSDVACSLSYSAFNSSPKVNATSTWAWTCTATTRQMTGNGIPDHSVVGGNFATPISAQSLSVPFPRSPAISAPSGTTLVRKPSGFALNSVKFDPMTDGTCASTATSTAPGGGCVAVMGRDPWNLEALGGAFAFGADENNAHVQPNGQYHYHGMPEGMIAKAGMKLTLVGFAMDGFPVYARFGYTTATDAKSAIKVMTPSWRKKATPDAGRPSTTTFPMGTFTQDFEYAAGSGDLDECNGRTGVTPDFPNGTYHYYITETFPFIQRCLKGTAL
jgi:hypothetical protein